VPVRTCTSTLEDDLSRLSEYEAIGIADVAPVAVEDYSAAPAATRAERLALRVLQLGAVVVVLAAAAYRSFELDRFFVPKELTLHLTALLAGLFTLRSSRRVVFAWTDVLLLIFLLLGAVSAALATNVWLGARALAVSASGVALFWAARALSAAGLSRPLLGALATAVVIGSATSLLQAYGVRTDFFSLSRAPGGTLGNRNFVAHMAAFGLPVVLLVALRARGVARYAAATIGAALVTAALILTRSRAGFLAFAAVLLVFFAAPFISDALRRHGRTWARLTGFAMLAGAGVAAAVLAPNTLRWRSENPYLESIAGVANYQEGSGRGRLVQYRGSMSLAMRNPLLGVGPGNWPVVYPAHAARGDPSLDANEPGTTSNPWPSSDWVAFASERGLPATILLGLAFLGIALGGLKQLAGTRDADEALAAAALLATLFAACVAGMFDAVLLLALPTLLVWTTLGALWSPADTRLRPLPAFARAAASLVVALLAGAGAARSGAQLAAMGIPEYTRDVTWLSRAAAIDPANYRLRIRLARGSSGLDPAARCRHARAAHDLLPYAAEARMLSRSCGR
jgi:O-antigen ligase